MVSRQRRRVTHLAAIATVTCGALLSGVAPREAAGSSPDATGLTVSAPFNVEANEALTLTIRSAEPAAAEPTSAEPAIRGQITVEAVPIRSRATVDEVFAGGGTVSDTVAVAAPAPGPEFDVVITTQPSGEAADSLTLEIGTIFALRVTTGHHSGTTLIHAVDPSDDEPPLPVAIMVGADAAVTVDSLGDPVLGVPELAELDELAAMLDELSAPVSVRLRPGVATALERDPANAGRLAEALSIHELLSEPFLPLSESSPAGLDGGFTNWLRRGEDVVSRTLNKPGRRVVGVIDHELSVAGAALRRDLGTRLLLFTHDALVPIADPASLDPTHATAVRIDTNELEAMTPDPRLAAIVAPDNPTGADIAARQIAAELLLERAALRAASRSPGRAASIVGPADLGRANPQIVAAFADLASSTPGLDLVQVDDIVGRLDRSADPALDLPAAPATPTVDRRARSQQMALLGTAIASMLPPGDPRPARWDQRLTAVNSSAVTDQQAETMLDAVSAEQRQVTDAVSPPAPFNATINSRSATLRLNFTNRADVPLKVKVLFTAGGDKVRFPDNGTVYELAPNAVTEVPFPLEARSNGRIPILTELRTPTGDRPITPALPLTLTINAVAGLGYLLSGAAALILVAWWFRHHRRLSASARGTLPDHD